MQFPDVEKLEALIDMLQSKNIAVFNGTLDGIGNVSFQFNAPSYSMPALENKPQRGLGKLIGLKGDSEEDPNAKVETDVEMALDMARNPQSLYPESSSDPTP